MRDYKKWIKMGRTFFPGIQPLPPPVTPPTPNFFLQVGRAVLLENDETRQANGVGVED